MRNAMGWRGRVVVCAGMVLGLACAAAAQDRPQTQPMPRPAVLATSAPVAPGPVGDIVVASASPAAARVGSVTGFPIPRYVSISSPEANARRGPSRSHRIDWVFQRRNMPVMIVAEHGHWRRVVDRDGAGGWIHYALLSGERTAIVEATRLPLYQRPDRDALVRAEAERGVIGTVRRCSAGWCEMEVGGFRGWVEATALWGVEPGETFD